MATWIVNNFNNNDLEWIKEYKPDEVVIYDKKDLNVGYNIHDYMDYIVKNYDNLPDLMFFIKGNILQRHITKEEFDKLTKNTTFTPILTQNHKTYLPVCYYENNIYWEINDSWYFNEHEHKYFSTYDEFCGIIGLKSGKYIPFAPGGCYIVPKENVLKRSKEFYQKLKDFVSYTQLPAEAHAIERALYTIWK